MPEAPVLLAIGQSSYLNESRFAQVFVPTTELK